MFLHHKGYKESHVKRFGGNMMGYLNTARLIYIIHNVMGIAVH